MKKNGTVGSLSCAAWVVVYYIFQLFFIAMLIYMVVSWIPSLQGRWSSYIARIVDPVLMPVRRVIPPVGGLDLSFLIVAAVLAYLIIPYVHGMTFYCRVS